MNIRHERIKIIFLMIIAYIILLIGVINSYPLHTSTDELGGIVGAAHFAGLEWSGVISNSGYYGFGYYSLFFWLFKITDSPIIIYRVIISITAFLRVLIIPIAYYISKIYLDIESEIMRFVCAFLMPFLNTTTVGLIANEYILELFVWLIILLVCKSESEKTQKRLVYMILLVLSCFYILLLHTRALTLIIAVLIAVAICEILKKKKINLLIIAGGILAGYYIAKIVISLYQVSVYGGSGGELRNGSVQVSTSFNIFDIKTWDVWIHMIIGLIGTETVLTGGLFLVSVVAFIYYLVNSLRNKFRNTNSNCNIILGISIMCMGATMLVFLVSGWFEGMLMTWGEEGAGNMYAYKGLMYVRYWNIYVPPFILCMLAQLTHLDYKKITYTSVILLSILYLLFIELIVPLVGSNASAASFWFGIGRYHLDDVISKDFYYRCILYSLFVFMILFAVSTTKYKVVTMSLLIGFMAFNQVSETCNYNKDVKNRMSAKINSSYEEKCKLDKMGIDIGNIYLNETNEGIDNNWKIYSIAQFYFNRYTLQTELPQKLGASDIIISTSRSNDIEKKYKNADCYVLDENEVWYTQLSLIGYEPVEK